MKPKELNEKYKAAIETATKYTSLDCNKCECDWSGRDCDYFGNGMEDVKTLLEIIKNQKERIDYLNELVEILEIQQRY